MPKILKSSAYNEIPPKGSQWPPLIYNSPRRISTSLPSIGGRHVKIDFSLGPIQATEYSGGRKSILESSNRALVFP